MLDSAYLKGNGGASYCFNRQNHTMTKRMGFSSFSEGGGVAETGWPPWIANPGFYLCKEFQIYNNILDPGLRIVKEAFSFVIVLKFSTTLISIAIVEAL